MGQSTQVTTIAAGVKVEGDFSSDGDVYIEGDVSGSVKTQAHLQIGQSATIEADVVAKSAVIAGRVQGNIRVSDHLELTDSSQVTGDVTTGTLAVATGAQLSGKVSMGVAPAAPSEDEE